MAKTGSKTPASDDPPCTPPKPKKIPKAKRASGSLRKANLRRGAFLIEFQTPPAAVDVVQRELAVGVEKGPMLTGKDLQSARDQYRTMERKGFRVTKDIGCLIPDEQYCTYQQGHTVKGHQRTITFFAHWCPKQGSSAIRNEHGWPCNLQVSHLCHRRSCCRLDHLIVEEQWRNVKRNFCGSTGSCDCGNPIKCLRRYTSQDTAELPDFCLTEEEVSEVMVGAPTFVIHPPSRYENRDDKSKQRKLAKDKRKRNQELHEHKTARKQSRLAARSDVAVVTGEPVAESSDDFM